MGTFQPQTSQTNRENCSRAPSWRARRAALVTVPPSWRVMFTFLFLYCSMRIGSFQSSLGSKSGTFPFSAFSRIRRSRSSCTRSLYLIRLRHFSRGRIIAKNEELALLRASQKPFSLLSADSASFCNCFSSFCSKFIFCFSSGCLSRKRHFVWDVHGALVHLGRKCPCLWQTPHTRPLSADSCCRSFCSPVSLESSSSALWTNTRLIWTFSAKSNFSLSSGVCWWGWADCGEAASKGCLGGKQDAPGSVWHL